MLSMFELHIHESYCLPTSTDKPAAVVKLKGKRRKKEVDKNAAKNLLSQLDSPVMGTRRKKTAAN
jgi:hypothetical protein